MVDPQQINVNMLGPRLIALFLQGFETGVIVNQSIQFWSAALSTDHGTELEAKFMIKLSVGFVTLVAMCVDQISLVLTV